MSILDKIRDRVHNRSDRSSPLVSVRADGFDVAGISVAWADIREITAHKIDLVTLDEIRFSLDLDSAMRITVSEEQDGFRQLVSALEKQFETVKGWQDKVVQPAFAPCTSLLYRRT